MTQAVAQVRHVVDRTGFTNPLLLNVLVTDVDYLQVYADDELLSEGAEYSVSGIGSPFGVSITIIGADDPDNYLGYESFTALYNPPLDQLASLSSGGGLGRPYELALDQQNRRLQSIGDRTLRAIKMPVNVEGDIVLPTPVDGYTIVWDADTQSFYWQEQGSGGGGGGVSDLMLTPLTIRHGSAIGALRIGADVNANTLTDLTRHIGRITSPSYDNSGANVMMIGADNNLSVNRVVIGGATGLSTQGATHISLGTVPTQGDTGGTTWLEVGPTGLITATGELRVTTFGVVSVDPVIVAGPADAVEGVSQGVEWLWGEAAARNGLIYEAWAGKVFTGIGIAKDFDSSHDSTVLGPGGFGSPNTSVFVLARNKGTNNDVCAVIFDAIAEANDTAVFGANIIARTQAALTGIKLVGLEVDVVPANGVIATAGIGMPINIFNTAFPGPAIQLGGLNGGTWANGVVIDGVAASGAGLVFGGTMDSAFNSAAATYGTAAIILSSTHKLLLKGTASAHALLYNHSDDVLRAVMGSAGLAIRNSGDTATLVSVDTAGQLFIQPPSGNAVLILNKAASGSNNILRGQTGGVNRWAFVLGNNTAEAGANAGSNFLINRYSDAGSVISAAINISRATGTVTFSNDVAPAINDGSALGQSGLGWADFYLAAGGIIYNGGVQVLGARDTGWTAMTGTPDEATAYATGSVTLPQLAGRVAAIQAALTTHGLIGA